MGIKLTPSPFIRGFIEGMEGLRLKAYLPTSKDVPTIGYGSTGPDIKLGLVWTQAQADARFAADLAKFGEGVASLVSKATQNQFDAMVSLAYNIGMANFRTSTVLRKHNLNDYTGAALGFPLFNKQKGMVLPGLVTRRSKEMTIYLRPYDAT